MWLFILSINSMLKQETFYKTFLFYDICVLLFPNIHRAAIRSPFSSPLPSGSYYFSFMKRPCIIFNKRKNNKCTPFSKTILLYFPPCSYFFSFINLQSCYFSVYYYTSYLFLFLFTCLPLVHNSIHHFIKDQ